MLCCHDLAWSVHTQSHHVAHKKYLAPSISSDAPPYHVRRFGKDRAGSILQDASLSHAERTAALQQAREALEAELRAKGMFRLEVSPLLPAFLITDVTVTGDPATVVTTMCTACGSY